MKRFKANPNPPHDWIPEDEWQERYGKKRSGPLVFADLPDVVSPIDGTVIRGRSGLREHFKRHRVTWADDFKEEWKKPRTPKSDSRADRIEALKYAYDKHSRRK